VHLSHSGKPVPDEKGRKKLTEPQRNNQRHTWLLPYPPRLPFVPTKMPLCQPEIEEERHSIYFNHCSLLGRSNKFPSRKLLGTWRQRKRSKGACESRLEIKISHRVRSDSGAGGFANTLANSRRCTGQLVQEVSPTH
jgi:hypothetical protein